MPFPGGHVHLLIYPWALEPSNKKASRTQGPAYYGLKFLDMAMD